MSLGRFQELVAQGGISHVCRRVPVAAAGAGAGGDSEGTPGHEVCVHACDPNLPLYLSIHAGPRMNINKYYFVYVREVCFYVLPDSQGPRPPGGPSAQRHNGPRQHRPRDGVLPVQGRCRRRGVWAIYIYIYIEYCNCRMVGYCVCVCVCVRFFR